MNNALDSLGGRKFVATVLCQIITGGLVWLNKIDGDTYSLVIIATVGAFIAGNVLVHKAQGKNEAN